MTNTIARATLVFFLLASSGCGRGEQHPLATPTATPAPYATGDYPEYGLAADLSWVAGEVFVGLREPMCTYVLFSNGRGAEWGGMFALQAAPGILDGVHPGERVVLHGSLLPVSAGGCEARPFKVTRVELH